MGAAEAKLYKHQLLGQGYGDGVASLTVNISILIHIYLEGTGIRSSEYAIVNNSMILYLVIIVTFIWI